MKNLADMAPQDRRDVEKSYWAYIYGDSHQVESFRSILEHCYAPFNAAIYSASQVIVESGASLIVRGIPAILAFEELEIHQFGCLQIRTACNALIERLSKKPATHNKIN